jgi:protocatechuate 3,4-dioxygenase alpha subunit
VRSPSPYGTIGPYFPSAFSDGLSDLTRHEGRVAQGEHILLRGVVMEERSQPTFNTIVEIWQPDTNGIFRHPLDPRSANADPGFFGWGRARTGVDGSYRFRTVLPGYYSTEDGVSRCPHIDVMILAIGLTRRLVTTVFFSDQPQAAQDPVLDCVQDGARRQRLFARRDPSLDEEGLPAYRFDIALRGDNETPFFLD